MSVASVDRKSVVSSDLDLGWIARHLNVLITGPTGIGKSFIAAALAHAACRMNYHVRCFRRSEERRVFRSRSWMDRSTPQCPDHRPYRHRQVLHRGGTGSRRVPNELPCPLLPSASPDRRTLPCSCLPAPCNVLAHAREGGSTAYRRFCDHAA